MTTYLGEPEEILHEQARVRVINLHHGDLVFVGHQDVVILVEDGCQVKTPALEGRQTSAPPPAASSIPQRVSFLREEEMPCPRSPLLSNSPWQKRLVAGMGAGAQRVPADTTAHDPAAHGTEMGQTVQGTFWVWTRCSAGDPQRWCRDLSTSTAWPVQMETLREPLISGPWDSSPVTSPTHSRCRPCSGQPQPPVCRHRSQDGQVCCPAGTGALTNPVHQPLTASVS